MVSTSEMQYYPSHQFCEDAVEGMSLIAHSNKKSKAYETVLRKQVWDDWAAYTDRQTDMTHTHTDMTHTHTDMTHTHRHDTHTHRHDTHTP